MKVLRCSMFLLLLLSSISFAQSANIKLKTDEQSSFTVERKDGQIMMSKTINDGSFYLLGTFGTGLIPIEGMGTRLMWYPKKAAFRAGYVDGTYWDDPNIGDYSSAWGFNTTAKAYSSFSFGRYNVGNGTTDMWILSDPIFEIGIGTGVYNRANALTVLKNGKVGVGTATPNAILDVSGDIAVNGNQVIDASGKWVGVASGLVGPRGEKGDKGDPGIQGEKGEVGATGVAGPQGAQGIQGLVGEKGDQGIQGEVGPQGIAGVQGPKGETGATGPAGNDGAVGPQGPIGPQGLKGDKGDTGEQGIQGDVGPQGLKGDKGDSGTDGAIGPQGPAGPIGLTGATGAQGVQGEVGATGPAGNNGAVGPQGPIGPQGLQGIQGEKGDKGDAGTQGPAGASPFELNGNDATYTQGNIGIGTTTPTQKLDVAGDVKANNFLGGFIGPSIVGNYANNTLLIYSNDNQLAGQIRLGASGGYIYGKNQNIGIGQPDPTAELEVGGTVKAIAFVGDGTGLTGIIGQPGPAGPQGPRGDQGIQGELGPQGLKGDKGDTGEQGPIGLTGPTGAQGEQGLKGDKGDQGIQGLLGEVGPQGVAGVQGPQGEKGDKGDQGIQGIQGPIGLTGAAGPQGEVGPQGPQGLQGDKGDTGATGQQGPIGLTGAAGPQGTQGEKGVKGDKGEQGPAGVSPFTLNGNNATYTQGNVGIGTTNPLYKLDVGNFASNENQYIRINASKSNHLGLVFAPDGIDNWWLYAPKNSNDLRIWEGGNGGTDRVTFHSGGNVGIGTTNPTQKLDVAGTVKATAFVGDGTGLTGIIGQPGPAGPQGAQGEQGPIGPQGPKGDIGATGQQGPIGLTGAAGPQGEVGPQGVAGVQGPQGVKGDKGDPGVQGPIGLTGPTGAQGVQGEQGPIGLTGPQGLQGEKGDKGDTGEAGASPFSLNGTNAVYTQGNVGIGTTSPTAKLTLEGDGDIVARGTLNSGRTFPITSGGSTWLIWNPRKAAFRTGFTSGVLFNDNYIGLYSIGMGRDVHASGEMSLAMGSGTNASGMTSTALGQATTASGNYSTSMGFGTIATGYSSTAIGKFNIGLANSLFEIGNGSGFDTRANIVTVLNNNNVGIGTTAPTEKLDVAGNLNVSGAIMARTGESTEGIYLHGGNDVTLRDVNIANTTGIYGAQDPTKGGIKLGSNGATISSGTNGTDGQKEVIVEGRVRGTAPGQVLNMVATRCFHYSTEASGQRDYKSGYVGEWKAITKVTYQPVSNYSNILIEFDTRYHFAGWGQELFGSRIRYHQPPYSSVKTIAEKEQKFQDQNGGGTRSGTLFPITGIEWNSSTDQIDIYIEIQNTNGTDDYATVYMGIPYAVMKITEIAR